MRRGVPRDTGRSQEPARPGYDSTAGPSAWDRKGSGMSSDQERAGHGASSARTYERKGRGEGQSSRRRRTALRPAVGRSGAAWMLLGLAVLSLGGWLQPPVLAADTQVACPAPAQRAPIVTLDPLSSCIGEPVEYAFSVTQGPRDGDKVCQIDLDLAPGFTDVAGGVLPAGWTLQITGRKLTWKATPAACLAPGATAEFTFTATSRKGEGAPGSYAHAWALKTSTSAKVTGSFDFLVEDCEPPRIPGGVGMDLQVVPAAAAVVPGETFTHIVTLTNTGDQPIHDVVLGASLIPAGLAYIGWHGDEEIASASDTTPAFTIALLGVGSSKILSLDFAVDHNPAAVTAPVVLMMTAEGVDVFGDPVTCEPALAQSPVRVPGVGLDVYTLADEAFLRPGRPIVYDVTVTNTGEQKLYNIRVTDLLPAGLEFLGSQLSPGVYFHSDPPPKFDIPELEPGAARTFALRCRVPADTTLLETPAIHKVRARGFDEAGDPVEAEPYRLRLPLAVPRSGLDLELVATGPAVVPGEPFTCLLRITNNGGRLLRQVRVTQPLPAGLELVTATHDGDVTTIPGDPLRFAIDRLRVRESKLIGLVLRADADYGLFGPTLTCGASARAEDVSGTEVLAEDVALTLPVVPAEASFTIAKVSAEPEVLAGDRVSYIVTVRNTGDQTLHDLTLTDLAPAGLTLESAQLGPQVQQDVNQPAVFTIPTLPVHGEETLVLTFATGIGAQAPADPVVNRVLGSALDEGGSTVTAEAELSLPLRVPPSGLALFKTTTQGEIVLGGTVTYLVTLVNTGEQDILGIEVTDTLPAGLTFYHASLAPNMQLAGDDPLVIGIDRFPAGASAVASITCRAAAEAGAFDPPVVNTMDATGTDEAGFTVHAQSAQCVLPLAERETGLDVEKVATATRIIPGRTVTYLVTVTNTGEETLYDVEVTDTITAGLNFSRMEADGDVTQVSTDPLVFRIPSLGVHESTMLSLIFESSNNHFDIEDPVVNVAGALGYTAGEEPVAAEPDSSVLPMLNWQKAIDVEKVSVESPFEAGGVGHYIITVTNTGVSPLTGVHLRDILDATDPILPPLTYIDSEPQGTWHMPNHVRWDLPDLLPGQSHTVILTVGVPIQLNNTEADNNAWVRAVEPDGVVVTDGDACTTPCRAKDGSIHLDKLPTEPRILMGGQVGYHLIVTNDGGQPLRRLALTDPVPDGLSLVTADYDDQRWRLISTDPVVRLDLIGVLEPTQSEALTFFFDASRDWDDYNLAVGDSTIVNEATVRAQDPLSRWVEDGDTAESDLLSPRAAVQLHYAHTTGEVVPGERTTYLLKIENTGSQVLEDVLLSVPDLAPQGLNYEDSNYDTGQAAEDHVAGFHRWRLLHPLAPNGSEQVRVTYLVSRDIAALPDPVASTASVTALDEEAYPLGDSASEEVPLSPRRGTITLDNSAAQGEIHPGETVTYVLTVQAGDELDLTDLVVTAEDLLASGLSLFQTNYDVDFFAHPDNFTWTALDTLAAGTQEEIRVTYLAADTIAVLPPAVTMIATASAIDAYGRAVGDEDDETLPVLLPESHLLLEKVALASALVPGEPLTYLITATNNGDQILSGLTVIDPLPEQLTTFASYHDSLRIAFDPDPDEPRWTLLEDLEPGEAVSVRLVVTSDPDPTHYGDTITDVATATATDEGGETVSAEARDTLPVHTPDIAVDVAKVPSQNVVVPGGTLAYTLLVQNVGRVDLTHTTLTEDVPAGLTYLSSSFDAGQVELLSTAPDVVWSVGSLPPGRATEIQVFFSVSGNPNDLDNPLVNTVVAESEGPGNQSAADLATSSLPVQEPNAAIRIAKRATEAIVRPGELLRYGIEVTNTGNLPLSRVVISDELAAGMTYQGSLYDPDLVELIGTPPELSWELVGEFAPGEQRTVDLIVYVDADPDSLADPFCNTAAVVARTPTEETVEDEATECLPVLQAAPRVTIQKFTTAPVIVPGEEFLYTIQVTNTGNRDIVKAYLREELPLGLSYVSSVYDPSVLSFGGNTRDPIWTVAALPLGATETVTVRLRAERDRRNLVDPVVNVASIEAWDSFGEHFTDSDFEETPVADIEPALSLNKLATTGVLLPGGTVTYLLTLTNSGDEDLFGVSLTDTLPAGLTLFSTDYDPVHLTEARSVDPLTQREVVTWSMDELKMRSFEQVRLSCSVTENAAELDSLVVNTAYARGTNILEQVITDEDSDALAVAGDGAAVDLAKSALVDGAVPGEYLTYLLTVRNAGTSTLHDLRLVERIPSGLTYDHSSFDNTRVDFAGASADSAVWTLATLPIGGFEEIRVTFLAASSLTGNAGADTLVNVATLTARDPAGREVSDNDDERLPIRPRRSGLQLLKWADATSGLATRGAEIAYHIQVVNTGQQDLVPVTVTDYMPSGLRFLEADQAPDSVVVDDTETRVYWTVDMLHAVESWEVLVRARIDTMLVDGQVIENRAHAVGIDERGAEVRDSDASRVLAGLPDIDIEKSCDRPIARPGEKVSYTITYRNGGTADATSVVVMDVLPEHTTYVPGSAMGGAFYEPLSNAVTRTVDRLEIDRGAIFSYQVEIAGGVPAGTLIPNSATVYADAISAAESDTVWVRVDDKALDLLKSVDQSSATVGDTLTYTLTYHNLSDRDFTWAEIVDPVPAEVDYVAGSAEPAGFYEAGDRRLVWALPEGIEAGAIGSVRFRARVRSDAAAIGRVTNEGLLQAATESDTTEAPSNRVVTLVVESVGVSLAKSVDRALAVPGDLLTYDLLVRNIGPAPLTAITVTDAVPEELTYVADPGQWGEQSSEAPEYRAADRTLTWGIGVLRPGESATLRFRAAVDDVPSGTLVSNLATVETHETEPVVSNPALTLIQYPDLIIAKTANLTSLVVGQEVLYQVSVRNASDGPTDSTWVTDALPEGFAYLAGSTILAINGMPVSPAEPEVREGATGGQTLLWQLGRLGAYAQVGLQYRAAATGEAGPGFHDNRAQACGLTPLGGTLCTDPAVATVEVVVPELTITKTTAERSVEQGDVLLYRITLQSNSAAPVQELTLRDHLPVGFQILPGSTRLNGQPADDPVTHASGLPAGEWRGAVADACERNVALWSIDELAGGEELELTYVVVVGLNASSGVAVNLAEAVGVDAGGGRVVAGPAEARVFVVDDELPGRLRGRVFIDCDDDGRPDTPMRRTLRFSPSGAVVDEQGNAVAGLDDAAAIPPYAGIEILVEDGRRVKTDANGEFFFYPLEFGDHAVYLDPRSLERGTQILGEDSRFFTVLEGGEARVQFRICPPPPRRGTVQIVKSVAPAEVVAVKRVLEPEVYLLEGILFETGKATLLPAADRVLAEAAQRLIEDPTATARVEGHTDIRPIHTPEFPDNYALSKARAEVVKNALAERFGIDASRMATQGFGPDRPVAPNTNARNLSLNRRTEIILLPSLEELTPAALFDPPEVTFHVTVSYQGDYPPGEGALREAAVYDALPAGLEYLLGSTRINGQSVEDPEILLGELSAGEGGTVTGERLLKWAFDTLWPGAVQEVEYRAAISDVPGRAASYTAEALRSTGTTPEEVAAQVAEVDAQLRDPEYRKRKHLWENRAWFEGVTASGERLRSEAVGADLELAFERLQKPVRIVLDDVFFDTGKATLRPEAFGVLDPAADIIRDRSHCRVRVEGHCDIRPIRTEEFPSNQELSEARAKAVIDYLVGVERLDRGLFSYRGFGERRPIADNETEAGRQKNRRVEIIISGDETAETSFRPIPQGDRPGTVKIELR